MLEGLALQIVQRFAEVSEQQIAELEYQVGMKAPDSLERHLLYALRVSRCVPVFAKCTLELGKSIGSASEEIRRFNNSTTKLTEQIIRLNKILVAATVVGAVAAIIGAISTLSN